MMLLSTFVFVVACYVTSNSWQVNACLKTQNLQVDLSLRASADNDKLKKILLKLNKNYYQGGNSTYLIDDSRGVGRTFDGIGGLSGGGATSKLLINYPEPHRTDILDFLFKPNFGASLQILKVEIGGDDQSSDGSESSHMHTETEENYDSGYEWWLMKEAKKRNPNIKLYGLAWSFPGWIGSSPTNPYTNKLATYLNKWIAGAKKYHGLDIDYIGVWNEKPFNASAFKYLCHQLKTRTGVKLVAGDDYVPMSDAVPTLILHDPELARCTSVIGGHYPGTYSTKDALKTAKPLWSSEDYSTFNNNVGAGCWARILNQNYVNGYMTSTIAWNLIASYYNALAWKRNSLMTANEPWSGHYVLNTPLWVTAHTTQFTQPGWSYLKHGHGVGHLKGGGSYVCLSDPTRTELSIIMETFQHNHSECVRPYLPPYVVQPEQEVTFKLGGSFSRITSMHVWVTIPGWQGAPNTAVFKYLGLRNVTGGKISLSLGVDSLVTITTVSTGSHGRGHDIPPTKPFPLPYTDNFDTYPLHAEPYNFAQQMGVFEVRPAASANVSSKVMQQVITEPPVWWCGGGDLRFPMNVIGNYSWSNITASVDVLVPSHIQAAHLAYLAIRVNDSPPRGQEFGCGSNKALGLYLFASVERKEVFVATDVSGQTILATASVPDISYNHLFNLKIQAVGDTCQAFYEGTRVIHVKTGREQPLTGFVAVGTGNFGVAQFDNFVIKEAHTLRMFL